MRKTTPSILASAPDVYVEPVNPNDNALDGILGAVPAAAQATRKPSELRPHPLNEVIYGDRADADLIASVRAKGVLNPILISSANLIISGHRRWGAAIAAGLDAVPVVVFGSDDELDIDEALIESNRQREKTNDQKGSEIRELARIISVRESRQGTNQYTEKRASVSPETEAKTYPSEKASRELGVSRTTGHRLVTVVNEIDSRKANGNDAGAVELRKELNTNVNRAYNQVRAQRRQEERAAAPPLPVAPQLPANIIVHNADSRDLLTLGIKPVHLVITSPPYNVGIDYADHDDVMSLSAYRDLLYAVFTNCHELMVDGARIAVVVPFGVGRNPWVPFASEIMHLLGAAKFTLRGQIIWDKGGSGNRTSWGSFRLPSDPSLRDTTEAIIVAHKGGGDLEIPDAAKDTDGKGTYTAALASPEYFMELAQDHWRISPESASRVGHPAPFPVELAKRLIDFYAYPGAHVLDPFAGAGSTAIAAKAARCDATLVELSAEYCQLAKERIAR